MEKLILFMFATSGLSWIIVKSKLFKSQREFITSMYLSSIKGVESGGIFAKIKYKLLWSLNEITNCEACMGFWSGAINSILIYRQINELTFVYGFAGSIINLLIISLNKFLNKYN